MTRIRVLKLFVAPSSIWVHTRLYLLCLCCDSWIVVVLVSVVVVVVVMVAGLRALYLFRVLK
jgi:hypothetical protein